jgi:hypothetical protein
MLSRTPIMASDRRNERRRFYVTVVLRDRVDAINYAAAIEDSIRFAGCVADTEDILEVTVKERRMAKRRGAG